MSRASRIQGGNAKVSGAPAPHAARARFKTVASGEAKFHDLALRLVPDRGTDEGWTVRCDLAPAGKIHLELHLYAD